MERVRLKTVRTPQYAPTDGVPCAGSRLTGAGLVSPLNRRRHQTAAVRSGPVAASCSLLDSHTHLPCQLSWHGANPELYASSPGTISYTSLWQAD